MADIYIEPSVAGMPDAAAHLAHFIDTGHRLILLGDCPTGVREALTAAEAGELLPDAVSPGSWRISDNPAACADRIPGLQTLLVGPRISPAPRPGARCDAEARDLASAVLEILGREAMG